MAPKIASVVAGVPLTFADQLLIQTWLQAAKQKHAESSKRSKKSDDGGMEEGSEYEKGGLDVASGPDPKQAAWELFLRWHAPGDKGI